MFLKEDAPVVAITKPQGTRIQDYTYERDLILTVLQNMPWMHRPAVQLVVKPSTKQGVNDFVYSELSRLAQAF